MTVTVYWSHSFLSDLIRPDGLVFDFGFNDGGFTRLLAPKCKRVIGFEPDPRWQNRQSLPDNAHLEQKALAARRGKLRLHVNKEWQCASLHYAESDANAVEVEAVTLEEALGLEPEGRIELIKMDIEGEEVAVLMGAPKELFSRVAQMTVEFHDFLDPASIPAIRKVIARMRSLGFYVFCFSWRSHGDLLFVNCKLAPLGLFQRLWLLARYKYIRGVGRVLKRQLACYKT